MLKPNSRQLVAMCLGATIAMSASAVASGKNLVAGTWLMVSAKADPDRENRDLFSSNPSGLLIFTKNLYFSEVLVNPEVPSFASSDWAMGTAAENKAVVAGNLALYGTYTVDEQGRFATEHVITSNFPNWTGMRRVMVWQKFID